MNLPTDRVRLLVADDNELFREGLALSCSRMAGIELIGVASDGSEAVDLARRLQPDVVLMDVEMTGCDGIRAAVEIVAFRRSVRILMLSAHRQPRMIFEAMKAGAAGYLLKSTSSDELMNAIHAVNRGDTVFDQDLASLTLGDLTRPFATNGVHRNGESALTQGESAVLHLVAKGRSNTGIAQELGLAQSTVGNRLREIYQKLQVDNRTQAALVALRRGWATLEVE